MTCRNVNRSVVCCFLEWEFKALILQLVLTFQMSLELMDQNKSFFEDYDAQNNVSVILQVLLSQCESLCHLYVPSSVAIKSIGHYDKLASKPWTLPGDLVDTSPISVFYSEEAISQPGLHTTTFLWLIEIQVPSHWFILYLRCKSQQDFFYLLYAKLS